VKNNVSDGQKWGNMQQDALCNCLSLNHL